MIKNINIKDFTAFHTLETVFEEGINIIIGANNTGKSHLLKLLYCLCSANKPIMAGQKKDLSAAITNKLAGIFKPEEKIGRLCRNDAKKSTVQVGFSFDKAVDFAFSGDMNEIVITDDTDYQGYHPLPVFIPPKEVIGSFPGFTSLYLQRELTIDETYFDLCQALETPRLKTKPTELLDTILSSINESIEGEFILMKQQRFYYKPTSGRMLEAELSAEGFRKLGMLQILLQNGRISPGISGPLFWDEPEANLNPSLMKNLVDTLLKLAREGQTIYLSTYDYVLLKWFDLLRQPKDKITYHVLFKDNSGEIALNRTYEYHQIHPNAIDDTFAELIDKDIEQDMGDLGK